MHNFTTPTAAVFFDLHNTLIYQSVDLSGHLTYVISKCKDLLPNLELEGFLNAWQSIEQAQAHTTETAIRLLENNEEWGAIESTLKETPIRMFIEQVLEAAHAPVDGQKVIAASDAFQESWMGGLRVIDGVMDLLKELAAQYRLGIVTNFRDGKRMRAWLVSNSLSNYFDSHIVISQEIGLRKPHPKLFEIALDSMGIREAEQAVYIGDDPLEDQLGPQLKGLRVQLVDQSNPDKRDRLLGVIKDLGLLP